MQTGNGRWYETLGREDSGAVEAGLSKPSLVELNLFVGVGIGDVVQVLVSERMAEVVECISIGCSLEPGRKGVLLQTGQGVGVACRSGWP